MSKEEIIQHISYSLKGIEAAETKQAVYRYAKRLFLALRMNNDTIPHSNRIKVKILPGMKRFDIYKSELNTTITEISNSLHN